MKILYCFLFYFFSTCLLHAQINRIKEFQVSAFSNATALPFSGTLGIFHSPLHPGISFGVSSQLNKSQKHNLLLNVKLAYLYQQYVQHGVQLYPEFGYRFVLNNGLSFGPMLGLGYLHAITDLQQFELNEQGEYQSTNSRGTPSFMASFGVDLGYDLRKTSTIPVRVFTQYQMWFQTPFVRSYVPVLPNTALHLGLSFYINHEK